ncbi:MAG TPA: cob(I)yrinic acid a,c-diamide adenosyltransferase [Ktedonobacter sp.]|nr:cob(I)yrinic acid a,c-diamide adenosyltransferase [Ktedonobacter sp.]
MHDQEADIIESIEQETGNEDEVEELTAEGRTRIREQLAKVRASNRPKRKGLVMVYTGEGKGKTTAALGLLFRAWGHDLRVVMLQFLKAKTGAWGEIRAAQRMGIEIIPLGQGFTWTSENLAQDRALAQECWQQCREKIESNQYDVVIMDEITYPLRYQWLNLDEILTTLQTRNPQMHIVLTGRDAPQGLLDYADLVTEMHEIKHPYKTQGLLAQRGIDF